MLQWYPTNSSPIMESSSLKALNAYLIKNATGMCGMNHSWREEFSCLSVYLVFTRDKSFYFSTVFVPGMVLVTSSFISFWLDVNAVPARVMIGVTTMLNFCTTTNRLAVPIARICRSRAVTVFSPRSFRSSLPVVSNLTAMNLWDFVCMIFIYASMLEFIIVNYLHRKVHHCNRPHSADGDGGRHHIELQPRLEKEELDARAPLVHGDDPVVMDSHVNHRQARQITAVISGSSRTTTRPSTAVQGDDRARVAASVFSWLRRPNIFQPQREQITTQVRLARSIDHISKTVFPFLYGVFSFTFFAVFAGYLPSLLDEWIVNEYRSGRSNS